MDPLCLREDTIEPALRCPAQEFVLQCYSITLFLGQIVFGYDDCES